MGKYKVCPFCGRRNLPRMLECTQCETDLSNVGVTDENTEPEIVDTEPAEVRIPMVRVCDCGAHNPVQARKCRRCGEDLSDVVPEPEASGEKEELHYVFASIDGDYAYEVQEGRRSIGREQEMRTYLSDKPYVSRCHADIYVEAGALYIENRSRTNYTYVNNQKIPDTPYELHDGDEIGLGGNMQNGVRQEEAAYFQVRIGTCI